MKLTQIIVTSAAAAIALSMPVFAEGDAKKPDTQCEPGANCNKGKHRKAMKKKMLERFDADKDGKLSEDERKTARETIRKERKEIRAAVLKEFDVDGDGKLSPEEREGVREWVKKNYPDAIRMHRGHRHRHMGPPHGRRGGKGGRKGGKGRGDAADS